MRFENVHILNYLWLLPVLAWGLFLLYCHRREMSARFVEAHLLDTVAQEFSLKRIRLKAVLLLVVLMLLILAWARPQWGYRMQNVKRQGLDIMVAIDVSKSMLTQDVKPSRLERTKLAVKDMVKKLKGDRVGLIAFAGQAFVMCPLTTDYNGLLMSLDDLNIDSIPRGGTDLACAIEEATKGYGDNSQKFKTVILVTDGEEEEGDALSAARKAKEKGIRIYTVGVGTKEGDLIQVPDADGQMGFLKDAQGNFIKSHLNENLLQQIAYTTGASYVRGGGAEFGLDYLYEQQLSKLEKRDINENQEKKYHERFQWFLTLALILLSIETLLTTSIPPRHCEEPKGRRGNLNLLVMLWPILIIVLPSSSFADSAGDVRLGNRLFNKGKYDEAINHYEKAMNKGKHESIVQYDLGAAYYKKGDFNQSIDYWQKALVTDDKSLRAKAMYNLGKALYKLGLSKENVNLDAAINDLEKSRSNFEELKAQKPKDTDIAANLEQVKKDLERLKKKKQDQKKQGGGGNDQHKKEQDKTHDQQSKDASQEKNGQEQTQDGQSQEEQKAGDNKKANDKNGAGQKSEEVRKAEEKKDQQDKQSQGKQSQEEAQGAQDQKTTQEQGVKGAQGAEKDPKQEQAKILLEDYERNEQPKGMIRFVTKASDERPVLKDW